MWSQYALSETERQAGEQLSQETTGHLVTLLAPLLEVLDTLLDTRLVRTLFETVQALIVWRDASKAMLLSELGAFLASPAHAPAGTKRLSRLLHSPRWHARVIEHFLWTQASQAIASLKSQGETPLLVWDESVLEKPESLTLEGLGSVRSSQARRLTRIKPGFYHPPRGSIFVPGMQWLGLLVVGMSSPPVLAALQWWTNRGKFAVKRRCEEGWWLGKCMAAWGREVLHVFDRGFAGEPWLEECSQAGIRFVMRWPKDYHLRDGQYRERNAWKIAQGKRSWGKRALWESHRQQWSQGGVVALPVTHPHVGGQFWLVVSRPGKGRLPWYLLTNEPIETEDDAWSIVFAYARRWRIEMAWRFTKSELGFESPRLWAWEPRTKLLMIASLAFAFLLSLLEVSFQGLRQDLLDQWCHRTGKRHLCQQMPLYRLREALSFLWLAIPPSIPPFQNSG